MSGVDKISIGIAMAEQGYTSEKGFKAWCKRHSVPVFKSGKDTYVVKVAYLAAVDKPLIEELKKQHPNDWEYYYNLYRTGDTLSVVKCQEQKATESCIRKHTATSPAGRSFLEKAKRA